MHNLLRFRVNHCTVFRVSICSVSLIWIRNWGYCITVSEIVRTYNDGLSLQIIAVIVTDYGEDLKARALLCYNVMHISIYRILLWFKCCRIIWQHDIKFSKWGKTFKGLQRMKMSLETCSQKCYGDRKLSYRFNHSIIDDGTIEVC